MVNQGHTHLRDMFSVFHQTHNMKANKSCAFQRPPLVFWPPPGHPQHVPPFRNKTNSIPPSQTGACIVSCVSDPAKSVDTNVTFLSVCDVFPAFKSLIVIGLEQQHAQPEYSRTSKPLCDWVGTTSPPDRSEHCPLCACPGQIATNTHSSRSWLSVTAFSASKSMSNINITWVGATACQALGHVFLQQDV